MTHQEHMATKKCLMYYWSNAILMHKVNGAIYQDRGLPRWHWGKESACQCRKGRCDPWVRKIPWRRKGQPTPVFLPGESQGQRSLRGSSPWGRKESDVTQQLSMHRGNELYSIFRSVGLDIYLHNLYLKNNSFINLR